MKIGSSRVSDLRRMRVNAIRSSVASQNAVSHHDAQFLLDELARVEGNLKQPEAQQQKINTDPDVADFAAEFLRLSIGSAEWESLRSVARNILKRSGQ